MKVRSLSVMAIAISVVGCASSPKPESTVFTPVMPAAPVVAAQPVTAVAPAIPHPYAMPSRPVRTVVQAPSWFVNLPADTAEMTFAAGTATSSDEQMAYDKARMAAERKLIEQMYSRISTQTNSFRADRGQTMIENFQQVTRKNARGELIGAQRVDSQTTHDGQVYKVYVLLRLPVGDANVMQRSRDQQRLQREAEVRGRAAERAMDANDAADTQRQQDADRALERSLNTPAGPVSQTAAPAAVTAQSEFKLLDVDNAEYKRRRDEALQKPGAVVGQIVVR